jgi:hypothetical protein
LPFAPFYEPCPDIARRETRTVTVFPEAKLGLPPANYDFIELYCNERGCDCRRVMFMILSSATRECEAVVSWGWESIAFYKNWSDIADDAMARQMQGPILNFGSPQGPYSEGLLNLTANVLLQDPAYVERIKRHYGLFRQQIDHAAWREHDSHPARQTRPGRPPKGKKRRRRRGA